MARIDQQLRREGKVDISLDRKHAERLKGIIAQIGWPTRSKVGAEASQMAWLLVQHADCDLQFQKYCLDLINDQPSGEVTPADIAFLYDRVEVNEGRPQKYGTQFFIDKNGELSPRPISDEGNLHLLRKQMGLPDFDEYKRLMKDRYRSVSESVSL